MSTGCVIICFVKFGTFVCVTLSAAIVFALVVFPAACAITGPDDSFGDLPEPQKLKEWTGSAFGAAKVVTINKRVKTIHILDFFLKKKGTKRKKMCRICFTHRV